MTSSSASSSSSSAADQRFISLSTYRRSGEAVPTPVWVAGLDGQPVAFTPEGAGKLKRLRRDPRVTVQPCDRRGRVEDDAPTWSGTATLVEEPHEVERIASRLRTKYGLEYRLFMLVERLVRRGRSARRVGLRLDLETA